MKPLTEFGRLAAIATLAGCACSPVDEADGDSPKALERTEQILSEMGSYEKMTPEPVDVNPELSRLCTGVSQDQIDAAAVTHGPHANCNIEITMNRLAAKSFRAGDAEYPEGAVILKHKDVGWVSRGPGAFTPKPNAIGGMIKRPTGYDPEHGNWEYFYAEQKSDVSETWKGRGKEPAPTTAGKLANCIDCHTNASDRDYVFGTWAARSKE